MTGLRTKPTDPLAERLVYKSMSASDLIAASQIGFSGSGGRSTAAWDTSEPVIHCAAAWRIEAG